MDCSGVVTEQAGSDTTKGTLSIVVEDGADHKVIIVLRLSPIDLPHSLRARAALHIAL